ncbi:FadR/GntR family transcriptional regulator [Oceanobacillus senegalensis]|uniref:FadR/GntR family transcriptional regulator n=1 Tax=Oceanobacillus senegalensis TaxID=1936063 RepID=UPI001FE4C016|nr:GntR family transcriptional regulator [Oceanobacillus senegalensis]
MFPNQKVYHGVLEQIRTFIEDNNLSPGDKLPSERELSDTLHAGRSSVREALRALELLGIIETKLGEGTFLSSYKSFQSVEILASFILRDKSTKESLLTTKKLIEKEASKLAFSNMENPDIIKLKNITEEFTSSPIGTHIRFFQFILQKTDNVLLIKIWHLIVEFSQTFDKQTYTMQFYKNLINLYETGEYSRIEQLFINE